MSLIQSILVLAVAVAMSVLPADMVEGETEQTVELAVESYSMALEEEDRDAQLAQFARAEMLFSQAVEAEISGGRAVNAPLYVNWGNAALQSQRLGRAIVAFRRALLVSPGSVQAEQNLQYARSRLPNWARSESDAGIWDTLFFWRSSLSVGVIRNVASLMFLVATLVLAGGIYFGVAWLRNCAALPAFFWILLQFSAWQTGGGTHAEAVVVVPDSILYSADSENSAARLADPLPDGVELQVIQERARWTEVQVAGKTGWVRSASIWRVE